MRLTEFTSETVLMFAAAIGNDIREVIGEVAAALRRSQANLLEPRNANVWRSEDRLSVIGSIRAKEQAQGLGIEAVVVVVEKLVEVACAKEKLVGQPRRQ